MQPMQLYWAPRLWGPRAMVSEQAIHFFQVLLALEIPAKTAYKSHC